MTGGDFERFITIGWHPMESKPRKLAQDKAYRSNSTPSGS